MEPMERNEEVGEVRRPRPNWAHPIASIFHIAFKIAGVLAYYLVYKFTGENFVITFITVVTIHAADFWTTKNVTGRLLVGLRWWNEVKEDGRDVWIFESLEDKSQLDSKEFWVFWVALIFFPVIWCFLAFGAAFSILAFAPQWIVVCIIVLALYGANLLGYWKCARDAKNRVSKYAAQTATSYLASSLIPAFLGNTQEPQGENKV